MERGEICIEGGIFVYETFNDSEEGVLVEELIAFVFRGGHKTRNISHTVVTDCSTNLGRTITIEVNPVFDGYRVGLPSSKTIRVNDIACGIRVEFDKLTVPKGGSTDYDVWLKGRPTVDVTVNISVSGDNDVTVNKTKLTFDSGNWDQPQTVTVNAAQDEDGVDDVATITHSATSDDTDYKEMKVDIDVTVNDNENKPAMGRPSISGTPQVGRTLTANTGGISDPDGLRSPGFEYQWRRDGVDIPDADQRTYRLDDEDKDKDKDITVEVTFTDDGGNREMLESYPTDAISGLPPPNTPTNTATPTNTPTPTQSNSGGGGGGGGFRPPPIQQQPPPPQPPPQHPQQPENGGGGGSGSSGGGGGGTSAADFTRSASYFQFQLGILAPAGADLPRRSRCWRVSLPCVAAGRPPPHRPPASRTCSA